MEASTKIRILITSAALAAAVFAAAAIALFAPAGFAQPAKRPISLDDLARIRSVGDPQRSPDGRWVAFTVGMTDSEKDRRDSEAQPAELH